MGAESKRNKDTGTVVIERKFRIKSKMRQRERGREAEMLKQRNDSEGKREREREEGRQQNIGLKNGKKTVSRFTKRIKDSEN